MEIVLLVVVVSAIWDGAHWTEHVADPGPR